MFRVFRHYISRKTMTLITVDLGITAAAVGVVSFTDIWLGQSPIWPKIVALSAVIILTLHLADLYRTDLHFGRRELSVRISLAIACAAILVAALGFAIPTVRLGRLAFFQIFGSAGVGLLLWRAASNRSHTDERLHRRVLVLGLSPAATGIVHLQTGGSQPFAVLGFLDEDPGAHDMLPPGHELLGKPSDLLNIVDELNPDLVLVALPDMRKAFPADDLLECRLRGIQVEEWPTFYEKQTGKILVTGLRPSWLIFCDGFVNTNRTQALKRGMDITLALIGLAVSLPFMALIAALIKLDSRGAILFRQERVGQNGKIFIVNKFRSMHENAERASGPVWASVRDPRVTRMGRFLRKARFDELPQLFNVLVGDMSFVGPRPERPEFIRVLRQRIPFYAGRLAVKPGITGWAQIRHQYAASVEETHEKLQYDLYYIKNLSLFLDLLILLQTVQVVLFIRGAR